MFGEGKQRDVYLSFYFHYCAVPLYSKPNEVVLTQMAALHVIPLDPSLLLLPLGQVSRVYVCSRHNQRGTTDLLHLIGLARSAIRDPP